MSKGGGGILWRPLAQLVNVAVQQPGRRAVEAQSNGSLTAVESQLFIQPPL